VETCRVEVSKRFPCLAVEEALALAEIGGCVLKEREESLEFVCPSCQVFHRSALIKSVNGKRIKRHLPTLMRSPKTLDYVTARVLVNLARVMPGSVVWEPFVGTGAIAYEIERVGGHVVGTDVDLGALRIAKLNVQGDLLLSDALRPPFSKVFDAVVGDPPYGRLTKSTMEVRALLNAFVEVAFSHVKRGGYVVLASPIYVDLPYLRSCVMYLHGGLYRVVYFVKF